MSNSASFCHSIDPFTASSARFGAPKTCVLQGFSRSKGADPRVLFLHPRVFAGVLRGFARFRQKPPGNDRPSNRRNVHVQLVFRHDAIDSADCNERWFARRFLGGSPGRAHGGRTGPCVHVNNSSFLLNPVNARGRDIPLDRLARPRGCRRGSRRWKPVEQRSSRG